MALSSFIDDDDVVSQLRSFFDPSEQWEIDFYSALSTVEDYDEDYLSVQVKDKSFLVHRVTGDVEEVDSE